MCRTEPVLVHETALLQLQAALFNDTAFLASCNHMDYSLVVGLDPTTRGLHVGIIGQCLERVLPQTSSCPR